MGKFNLLMQETFIQSNFFEVANIISSLLKTTLGPRSMLKMILDNQGRVIITNDGNCILREIDIKSPIAKSLIELSNTQDGEIGDGTTSVVLIASELLMTAKILLQKLNPNVIINCYLMALEEILVFLKEKISIISKNKGVQNSKRAVLTSIGTKLTGRFSRLICELSLKAVHIQKKTSSTDFNVLFKIEKIPAFNIERSKIISGIILTKDVAHSKMRRKISRPRILLLDCDIEFKKGETKSNLEISKVDQWRDLIKIEEDYEIYL